MSAPEPTAELLPPNFRKHVDPAAPMPLRMMAAKALVPLQPRDMVTALFLLTRDKEQGVADAARKSAAGLPDKILSVALRDEDVHPKVLDFFGTVVTQEQYQELLLLNATTPDATVAVLAKVVPQRLAEIVSQNQLRFLREPVIIRQLAENPNCSKSTLDGVMDFAVRSGLVLEDMPSFMEARKRILGDVAPPPKEETAQGLIDEFGRDVAEETEQELEEGKRLTITQRIMKMNVSEKIKLATLGNKEARTILMRDSNKLVQLAAIQSPRLTVGEVLMLSNNRTVNDEVLRNIIRNREWMKSYQLKVNLVSNPKTPLPTALKLMPHLHLSDLKLLARNRNVPATIQNQARIAVSKKSAPTQGGGGHGH